MLKTTSLRTLLLLALAGFFFTGCEQESDLTRTETERDFSYYLDNEISSTDDFPDFRDLSQTETQQILERIESQMEAADLEEGEVEMRFGFFNRDIALFKAAILVTGLAPKVVGKRVTAFAPDNRVFRSLGIQRVRDLVKMDRSVLRNILKYHLVPGRIFSTDIEPGFVHTLNGAAVELSLDGGVMVNDAMVTRADIFDFLFFNGVVHKIDGLLTPPTQNIVEIAIAASQSEDPQFTALVEAVVTANLAGTLSGEGPFTVFAPTDAAFDDLIAALPGVNSIADIPLATLEAVLLYHVVPARVFSSDLSSGVVQTLGGPITIDAAALTIDDTGTDIDADIIGTDIQGTNGVIHVINKVLLP